MSEKEPLSGFDAMGKEIDLENHIVCTYLIESAIDIKKAALGIAREQSTAVWRRVGVDEDLRPRFGAKVIAIERKGLSKEPLLKGLAAALPSSERFVRAEIKIAFPLEIIGSSLSSLLTIVAGEGIYHTHAISASKLLDIKFPPHYLTIFTGPRFGADGIRKLLHVNDRPLFCGVVKPNIGLTPTTFAQIAHEALAGGLDIAKDDEMLTDAPYSPLKHRLSEVAHALHKAMNESGEEKLFIANITDDAQRTMELYDIVSEHDHVCAMLNVLTTGLGVARALAERGRVPLVAHFELIAPLARINCYGISYNVLVKLMRLAGCDLIITPGLGERMAMSESEVLSCVQACKEQLTGIREAMPALGGGDWAGSVARYCAKFGHEFTLVVGGGVFAHPMGPRAGARSLRLAWQALREGKSLKEMASQHPEISAALQAFGSRQ